MRQTLMSHFQYLLTAFHNGQSCTRAEGPHNVEIGHVDNFVLLQLTSRDHIHSNLLHREVLAQLSFLAAPTLLVLNSDLR